MCLEIVKNAKAKKPNADGYCIGWKVVDTDNGAPYHWVHGGYLYKEGKNVSDRLSKDIQSWEHKNINHGFHVYGSRKSARLGKIRYYALAQHCPHPKTKIIKVYFKPEDVIAYGTENEIAVIKLTINSLKGE